MNILAFFGPEVGLGHHVLFGAEGESSIHPAILTVAALAVILMFVLRRKYVVAPLLTLAILCPLGQLLMIGSFHFQILRILVIFVWIRLLWERYGRDGQRSKIRLNSVDKAVILYAISSVICYTLLWQESAAFFSEVGHAYNVLAFYFAFRLLVRDHKDVERAIKVLAVTALVIAAIMLNEQLTGRNILAVFGGVPQFTSIRNGSLRSQGPFTVYLTAGAFGATLLPLFLCLWHRGGSRLFAVLGILAAITIAITSRTSTAISACLATGIGLVLWGLRDRMNFVRRALVIAIVGLHLVMKAPVWALLGRIDIVGGSTGWHRYKILDNCIHHFWDWWLLGSNSYWTWDGGDDMWDLANQYVSTAEGTGLLSLIFFVAAIVYCFKYLGKARKAAREDRAQQWFLWLLGVALFSNLIAFLGISYYDQTFVYWYALLAMIVTVSSPGHCARTVPVTKSAQAEPNGWGVQLDRREAGLSKLLLG